MLKLPCYFDQKQKFYEQVGAEGHFKAPLGSKEAIYAIEGLGVREARSSMEPPQPMAHPDAPLLDVNVHVL